MTEVNILHLSDTHFKEGDENKQKTYAADVTTKLITAVSEHIEEHSPHVDYVAFTGDIAFNGRDYGEAWKFFSKLKEKLSPDAVFLIVPGNHDVDRKKVKGHISLHDMVENQKTDNFLESKEDINYLLIPKFKAYREFVDRIQPGLYELEDDYYWVHNDEDRRVTFLGLNSAWACQDDDDRFKITLGYPQVMGALDESLAAMPFKIALMHHPPENWFEGRDFGRYYGELEHHCFLILHGHKHKDDARLVNTPTDRCITLGANASYTKEGDGFVGFQFIRINCRKRRSTCAFIPTNWKRSSGFSFCPPGTAGGDRKDAITSI